MAATNTIKWQNKGENVTGISIEGQTFDVDGDGCVELPSNFNEDQIRAHGFVPYVDAEAEKKKAEEAKKAADAKKAEDEKKKAEDSKHNDDKGKHDEGKVKK